MKPALSFKEPQYPKSWSDLPNGELILSEINRSLAPWWSKFFGYHLLKVGSLSHEVSCIDSAIKHHVSVSDDLNMQDKESVIADIDDLPFLAHSVDVCLLSHALEFSLDPHHVVREANRVLIPNGYLVITGFNPLSMAGLNKLIPYRRRQLPWSERFFTPMRVKDWLHLMGYEILSDQRCIHRTLANKALTGKIWDACQKFAQRHLMRFGSVYIIIAKKRVLPLTPIKPKWKLRPKFSPVKVSSMNSPKTQSELKRGI